MAETNLVELVEWKRRALDAESKLNHASALTVELQTEVRALQGKLDRSLKALRELNAMVWGECSSLLNEDSGGNGQLAVEIEELLK